MILDYWPQTDLLSPLLFTARCLYPILTVVLDDAITLSIISVLRVASKGALRLLVLRLVCLRKCGRFYEPEQCDQPEPWALRVDCSVGRSCLYAPDNSHPSRYNKG
jgi:hypothetical protein